MPKTFKTPEAVREAARAVSAVKRAQGLLATAMRLVEKTAPNLSMGLAHDVRILDVRIESAKRHYSATRKAAREATRAA